MSLSAIHQRYQKEAEALFPIIARLLSDRLRVGIALSSIGERELELSTIWRNHPQCRVSLSWKEIIFRHRKRPKRMDVGFYSADILCGLMIATISRTRVNVNLTFLEANPDPGHPLKSNFLLAATLQAEIFAQLIGASSTSISKPDRQLIRSYKALGYQPISGDRSRELKGMRPRYAQLIKRLNAG